MKELKIIAGGKINGESKEPTVIFKAGNARANIGISHFTILNSKKL